MHLPSELEDLTAKIADDEPIDWQEVSYRGSGVRELDRLVRGFRQVQELTRQGPAKQTELFRFGHLRVLKKIGSGALGQVYQAYDPNLDLNVALKLRKTSGRVNIAEALREAKCLAKVRQANVVSIFGAAEIDGNVGIWTELVRGSTLEESLTQEGVFEPSEVRSIALDLCNALAAVHRQGLTHGDIKLQNVMREHGGRTVLVDFGIAKSFEFDEFSGFVSGTLRYVAPEVLAGEPPSARSDQYSLGVLLFRLLTGHYPYPSQDYDSLLLAHRSKTTAKVSAFVEKIPADLANAIERAINPDKQKRFASIQQFGQRLIPARQVSFRTRLVQAAAAAIVAAVAGLAAWHSASAPLWETNIQFYRINGDGQDPIANGNAVTPGDRVALDFQTTRPVYLYVLDDDGKNSASVLFPQNEMQPGNPLPANVENMLPGNIRNKSYKWKIENGGLNEEFIVIASVERRPELENLLRASQLSEKSGSIADIERSASLVPSEPTQITRPAILDFLQKEKLDVSAASSFSPKLRYWRFKFPHSLK